MEETQSKGDLTAQRDFFLKYAVIMAYLSVISALVMFLIAPLFYPDFSWITNTISNMGNVTRGSQYQSAPLIIGSYLLSGVGTIPLFIHYARICMKSKHRLLRWGTKIMIFAALDLGILGIAAENYDVFHFIASQLFFLFLALGVLFIAASWLKIEGERKWAIFNLIMLFTDVAIWLLYFLYFDVYKINGIKVNQALFELSTAIDYAILVFLYAIKAYKTGLKI
jgi:hypothetical membrane protein